MKYTQTTHDGEVRINAWVDSGVDLLAISYVWEAIPGPMVIETSVGPLSTDAWGFGIKWFAEDLGPAPDPAMVIRKLERRGFSRHKMRHGQLVPDQ